MLTARTQIFKTLLPAFTLLLFFASSPLPGHAQEPAPFWNQYGIKLKDLSRDEREILEQTFQEINNLKQTDLRVKPEMYQKLSRFEELFGFPFDGTAISDWVLKRIRKIEQKESWTALVNHRKGTFRIGKIFFEELSPLERMYALVHEARHSDDDGHKHAPCPEGFPYVSAGQPMMPLEKERACDKGAEGAYAFQAAFLFEIYAYGLLEPKEAGLLYNSSMTRILQPLP
ncbi:MAG TPA: hypothetical protein VIU33_01295 [Nitrospiria bacterium]